MSLLFPKTHFMTLCGSRLRSQRDERIDCSARTCSVSNSSVASAPWSCPSPSSCYANSKSENQLANPVPAHKLRPRDHGTTHHHPPAAKFRLVKTQAAKDDGRTKPRSMICADCDGNGAVLCSQCKGDGVNPEDLFNGQFKAGDSCWLCGGRKHMLCGNCNGAGFVGGFMSTYDE